jgi:hypothetical protein
MKILSKFFFVIRAFTVEEVRTRNRPPYPLVPSLEHVFERALTGREPFITQPESRDKNIGVYDMVPRHYRAVITARDTTGPI